LASTDHQNDRRRQPAGHHDISPHRKHEPGYRFAGRSVSCSPVCSKHLPANITYAQFDKQYKLGTNTVLPTISDDLKAGAIKATIWSVLIICLYIFIRFRDWRYSLGTIVALLHDVLVTLAVFSFLRNVVPFPLEIDQHFIAAVLTVIGFSMNDTVIVFDRIREYSRHMIGAPKETIINKAINDTLSRTIMTSLTVFLTILILFLVGGEVTRGFAFAMLIGVVTGTYSSIFVAAPILVDLGGKKALGSDDKAVSSQDKLPRESGDYEISHNSESPEVIFGAFLILRDPGL
jgi:SecD/SecF fusion protein